MRLGPPLAAACAAALLITSPARAADDSKRVCAYTAHHIDALNAFSQMVGRDVDCALVYNDASPDWAGWENPWFLHHPDPNLNWARWATAPGTSRQLIITQNLFPSSENNADWRHAGARGDYASHAVALARNLVAAGLGDAVIRLGHEANGTWYPDSIGSTDSDFALWVAFWRQTVLAMRSVPGANFRFDWCVNAAWRPIALSKFYPGDDVVDIVGIDAYDSGVNPGLDRWSTIWSRTGGVRDVLSFATGHAKPLSIPEWGVGTPDQSLAGGDDPAYVDGIAGVVRDNRVAYQAYFYNYQWATQLANGPLSLAAYRRHFGAGGDATSTPATTVTASPPASAHAPVAPAAAQPAAARSKATTKARPKAKRKAKAKTRRKRTRRRVVRAKHRVKRAKHPAKRST